MNKFNKLNSFLNKVDVVGIASDDCDEYDIEAKALVENFDSDMSLGDLSELFTECIEHFFASNYVLNNEQLEELYSILKSQ